MGQGEYDSCDEMEYEYTNDVLQAESSNFKGVSVTVGRFQVPQSFHEKIYSKPNVVADYLDSLHLDDDSSSAVERNKSNNVNSSFGCLSINTSEQEARTPPNRRASNNSSSSFSGTSLYGITSPPASPTRASPPSTPPNCNALILQSVGQNNIPSVSSPISSSLGYSEAPSLGAPLYENAPARDPSPPRSNYNYSQDHLQTFSPTYINNSCNHEAPAVDEIAERINYVEKILMIVAKIAVVFAVGYVAVFIFSGFYLDVKDKMEYYMNLLLHEKARCQHRYHVNKCDAEKLVPAIVEMCSEWERCLLQPVAVSRTKAIIELIGEMIELLSSILSPKSMIMCGVPLIVFIWALMNSLRYQPASSPPAQNRVETLPINPGIPRLHVEDLPKHCYR